MEQYGVFLDDDIKIENKPKCVCLGATCGRIEITGFNVCEIYAKHNAKLNVIAKDNAFVVIDVFDDAVVNVWRKRPGESVRKSLCRQWSGNQICNG